MNFNVLISALACLMFSLPFRLRTKSLYELFIYPILLHVQNILSFNMFLNVFIHGNGMVPNEMDEPDSRPLPPLFLIQWCLNEDYILTGITNIDRPRKTMERSIPEEGRSQK